MNRALDVVEKNRDGKAALVITSNDPKFFSNGMYMPYLKNSFEEAVDMFPENVIETCAIWCSRCGVSEWSYDCRWCDPIVVCRRES